MNQRIASKPPLNLPLYFLSTCSVFRFSSSREARISLNRVGVPHNLDIDHDCLIVFRDTGGHGHSLLGAEKQKTPLLFRKWGFILH
jgi:hypothetical protein